MFTKKVRSLFSRWMERDESIQTPQGVSARFTLSYGSIPVGVLALDGGCWTFSYTDQFKGRSDLRPVAGFPDVTKKYESRDLWPFFGMRIPGLKQTAIQDILKREAIDQTDEVQLLKRFGRRTVSSPFELVAV